MPTDKRAVLQEKLAKLTRDKDEAAKRAQEFRLSMYIEEERVKKCWQEIDLVQHELSQLK